MRRTRPSPQIFTKIEPHRESIDKDIAKYGTDSYVRQDLWHRYRRAKPQTLSVSTLRTHPIASIGRSTANATVRYTTPVTPRSRANGNSVFMSNAQGQALNSFRGGSTKQTGNTNNPQRSSSFRRNVNNNGRNGPRPTKGCGLCGVHSHNTTECKNMIGDDGVRVNLAPSYGTCAACPAHVSPRLHHPPKYCPFRPGGLFNKRN